MQFDILRQVMSRPKPPLRLLQCAPRLVDPLGCVGPLAHISHGKQSCWHVSTERKVNLTREDGETYCFSSDKALDASSNAPALSAFFARILYGIGSRWLNTRQRCR